MDNHNNWTDMDGVRLEKGQFVVVSAPDGLFKGTIVNFGKANVVIKYQVMHKKYDLVTRTWGEEYPEDVQKALFWKKRRCLVLDKHKSKMV